MDMAAHCHGGPVLRSRILGPKHPIVGREIKFSPENFHPGFQACNFFSHNLPIFMSCLQEWHMKTMETEPT